MIYYYAGDRLVGSPTDTKPLTVRDGAIFHETGAPYYTYIKTSGQWISINSGSLIGGNGNTRFSVTGSTYFSGDVLLSGINGTQVILSGNNTVLFSGGAGGNGTVNNNYYINSGSGLFVFRTNITSGVDKQFINFPAQLDSKPLVVSALHNDNYDLIIPHQISGINHTGFWTIFGDSVSNTGYYLDTWACNSTGTGLATTVIVNNTNNIGGSGGVSSVNGLSGVLQLSGINKIGVSQSGNTLFVSGQNLIDSSQTGQFASNTQLTQTGIILFDRDNSISGAINTRLTSTGQTLNTRIDSLSGYSNNTFATLTNLTQTGVDLIARDNSISGAISTRLTQTGITLNDRISNWGVTSVNSISGAITLSGAGGLVVQNSGSNTLFISGDFATNASVNSVSGALDTRLTQTGVNLIARDNSISGIINTRLTNTGIALNTRIDNWGVKTINSRSGDLVISGINQIQVTNSGANTIFISGVDIATATNLTQTGVILLDLINASSAGVSSINSQSGILTFTGSAGVQVITNGQSFTFSGINLATTTQLTNTGVTLINLINGLSGQLNQTGSNLQNQINTINNNPSGYITGDLYWSRNSANTFLRNPLDNVGLNISSPTEKLHIRSGNLFIDSVEGNLTGKLFFGEDGSKIYSITYDGSQISPNNYLSIVSDFLTNKTLLRTDQNGNFQIYGNLEVQSGIVSQNIKLTSGASNGHYLISDSQGNASWFNLNTGQFASNTQLTNSGVDLIARDNSVSGALDTRLTQTGVDLISRDNSISGALNLRLSSTGAALISRDNSISGALSLRLTTTGVNLQNQINAINNGTGNFITQVLGGPNYAIRFVSGNQITGNNNFIYDYLNEFIGIGTGTPSAPLTVKQSNNSGIINFGGGIPSASRGISIEYRDSDDAGRITAIHQGTAFKNILINPAGGLVGIGTTNVTSTLEVGGFIRASGIRLISGAQNGRYLISNANGDASWSDLNTGQFASVFNLTQTGVDLIARDNSISGAINIRLTDTGLNLQNQINSINNGTGNFITGDLYWNRNGANLYPSTISNFIGLNVNAPTDRLHIRSGNIFLDAAPDQESKIFFGENGARTYSIVYNGTGVTPNNFLDIVADFPNGKRLLRTDQNGNFGISGNLTIETGVSIGTGTIPNIPLLVRQHSNQSGIVTIGGTIPNGVRGLSLEYGDANDAAVIGAVHQGTAFKNVLISPAGGFVGIGTSSPTSVLEVGGIITSTGIVTNTGITITRNGTAEVLRVNNLNYFSAKNSVGVYEPFLWPRWSDDITYLNYGSGGLNIRNANSQNTIFATHARNVGIKTAFPQSDLHVAGHTFMSGIRLVSGAQNGHVLTSDSAGNASWQTNIANIVGGPDSTIRFVSGNQVTGSSNFYYEYTSTGRVVIRPVSGANPTLTLWPNELINDGTRYGAITLNGSTAELGIANPSAEIRMMRAGGGAIGAMDLRTKSSEAGFPSKTAIYINSSQNVGLGTQSPSEKIDVSGYIRASGIKLISGAQNGHVLTSDSAGNASWQASSAGSTVINSGYVPLKLKTISGNYTLVSGDDVIMANAPTNDKFTLTLPNVTNINYSGKLFRVKFIKSSPSLTGFINITGTSNQLIDYEPSINLVNRNETVSIIGDTENSMWRLF